MTPYGVNTVISMCYWPLTNSTEISSLMRSGALTVVNHEARIL